MKDVIHRQMNNNTTEAEAEPDQVLIVDHIVTIRYEAPLIKSR